MTATTDSTPETTPAWVNLDGLSSPETRQMLREAQEMRDRYDLSPDHP
jgi:hypothetical protein